MALLSVRDLTVKFAIRGGAVTALDGISFDLEKGERLGIVGESGAGKSITGFALMNLLSRPGFIDHGEILFDGDDVVKMSPRALRTMRGDRMAMIFQDPMVTLNPVLTIGQQMVETLLAHRKMSVKEARQIALMKLREVYIPSPEERLDQYPHELSGGMRQRIVIAIALLLEPRLIIADEPTTALDVTIQADIMELLLELCQSNQVSLILITHDLGVVSQMTERTLVMYAGRSLNRGARARSSTIPSTPIPKADQRPAATDRTGPTPAPDPGINASARPYPAGCAFHPRCAYATDHCRAVSPKSRRYGPVEVACHEVERLSFDQGADESGTQDQATDNQGFEEQEA